MMPLENAPEDEFASVLRRAVALSDAPPAVLYAAVGLWPARTPPRAAAQGLIERMVATLRFDSWSPAPLALGVRGAASDTRHLLFSTMGRDIDLRIAPAADRYSLAGQVLGPDPSGIVELVEQRRNAKPENALRSTALDSLGEFRIDDVHAGRYALIFRLGQEVLVLPDVDVGQRRS